MSHTIQSRSNLRRWGAFLFLVLCLILATAASRSVQADQLQRTTSFFMAAGTLAPGESVAPNYLVTGQPRPFIFRLAVSGDGDLDFTVHGSDHSTIWDGAAQSGEIVWGYGSLPVGNAILTVSNNSASSASYDLALYDVPAAPYAFAGSSAATGETSTIRLAFPSSGLYTFTLLDNSGRIQLRVGDDLVRKTLEDIESVTLYVPAGTHDVAITHSPFYSADWSLEISGPGATADALPYVKSGDFLGGAANDFPREIMPVHLVAPTTVVATIEVAGNSSDALRLDVNAGTAAPETVGTPIYGGEKIWLTLDLPAGSSYMTLDTTGNAAALGYTISLNAVMDPPIQLNGFSTPQSESSQVEFSIATAGLYQFDYGIAGGRYQARVDVDYIQKNVTAPASASYYLSAGTHSVTIDPDPLSGAEWQLNIAGAGGGSDPLPYAKEGVLESGADPEYATEWLPIALETAATVNVAFTVDGGGSDALEVEIYHGTVITTADLVLEPIYGTETVWTTLALPAGISRFRLQSSAGNSGALAYALTVAAHPTASAPVAWSGVGLDVGQDATFAVNFPAGGAYRFDLETVSGFAVIGVDDAVLAPPARGAQQSFDVIVPAGIHVVRVAQDPAYPSTEWNAAVAPVSAGPAFFSYQGTIGPGDSVAPVYPVDVGPLDFNFVMTTSGANIALDIAGNGGPVWSDVILDGERAWGTAALPAGDNTITLTNNGAAAADVSLTFYTVPQAPYAWSGLSDGAGRSSEIRVSFPSDGLYTFDLGQEAGRYQLQVAGDHIRKTVEMSGTVALFVPAGTHALTVAQDTGGGAQWNLAVSAAGAASDTLPYVQHGGMLGGAGNDFAVDRLPIRLAQPTTVNVALTVSGDPEPLIATFMDETRAPLADFTVFGGETRWQTVDLPAGTTYLELNAGAAATPLSYEVSIEPLPEPALSWTGAAIAAGGESVRRVNFPSSGLYTFDLAATGGNIAFQVAGIHARKLAVGTDNPQMTIYVPAGVHPLFVTHDAVSATAWSVDVSAVGAGLDSLPYVQSSAALGAAAGFDVEWFPLYTAAQAPVNVRLDVTGAPGDALTLELYDGLASGGLVATLGPVFGGESVWLTPDLAAAGMRLRFVADSGNAAPLSYTVAVDEVPAITGIDEDSFSWSGTATALAVTSAVRVDTRLSGLYHVEMVMPAGFATLFIDEMPPPPTLDDTIVAFDVSLAAGEHTFYVDPAANFPATTWSVTVTLLEAEAPTVTGSDPISATDEAATPVVILGANFMPGAIVELVSGGDRYALESVVYEGAGSLSAMVPAGLPLGLYDLVVTNPDDQSGGLPGGFTIFRQTYAIYLPLVRKP